MGRSIAFWLSASDPVVKFLLNALGVLGKEIRE